MVHSITYYSMNNISYLLYDWLSGLALLTSGYVMVHPFVPPNLGQQI